MHSVAKYFLAVACLTGALHAAPKPNILLIYLDDFGWKDASYMGSDFYETPNLDKLARGGMVFTDAYANAANCAPSRASLLCGQYTPRHRVFSVGTKLRGNPKHSRLKHIPGTDTLDPGVATWAQVLRSTGYRTGLFGKWHLSNDPKPYGFDVNIGGTHGGGPPGGYYPPHKNAPGLSSAPSGEWLTDTLAKEVMLFIDAEKSRPWCVYLAPFAVHTPIQAKQDLVGKYEAKAPGKLHKNIAMATMIQGVDDAVGKIIGVLEKSGERGDTVIIFTSDNGGYGPVTDMDPLKGYKGTYYEGGIRVPLFVNWPGVIKPGSVSSTPVIATDLFPTICEFAGAEKPSQDLDGKSLVPLLRGEAPGSDERPLFWHFPTYLESYGGGHSSEQHDPLFRTRPCGVIRLGDWKLIEYFEDGTLELFHLSDDIGETKNLAKSMPAKAEELLSRLEDWRKGINAPVPREPNPEFDEKAEAEARRR